MNAGKYLAGVLQLQGRSAAERGTLRAYSASAHHLMTKVLKCSNSRAEDRLALCPVWRQVTALLSCNILRPYADLAVLGCCKLLDQ
jgi:hypothetical protein